MQHIRTLRTERITTSPILYTWWFQKEGALQLLQPLLAQLDLGNIHKQQFEGQEYYLLYVGIGKNGHGRLIDYHILDKNRFHEKGVANGLLSSLRQTLCGLLGLNMSSAKAQIDLFIDTHAAVEFTVYDIKALHTSEKDMIRQSYPPLNYQHTTSIFTKEHRRILRALKKKHKC